MLPLPITVEIMINNVMLTFFPTDGKDKTPYEQGENRTVILFSR